MFPQLNKLNNESGVVLFIVLMTAIIIMIMSVGIMTQSMNEVNYAQQQIDQIASEEYTKGLFWQAYSSGSLNPGMSALQSTQAAARTYQLSLAPVAGSTVNGITQYSVVASYNSGN